MKRPRKPRPFHKRPKRSNPLKWAAWGAFVGLAVIAVRAGYGVPTGFGQCLKPVSFECFELVFLIAQFIVFAVGGAFLAGITAFIRNWFIW